MNLLAYCIVTSIPFLISACASRPVEVAQPVKETVVVEKVVTRVVRETVLVLKEVTRLVPQTVVVEKLVLPTETPQPVVRSIGAIEVNEWLIEITEVRSDPGPDPSRQLVVILGNVINQGMKTGTFTACYKVELRDSKGRVYEDDSRATSAARRKYGTDIPASISPGDRRYAAFAFNVPASEKTFTLVRGSLAQGWSGDITFTLR